MGENLTEGWRIYIPAWAEKEGNVNRTLQANTFKMRIKPGLAGLPGNTWQAVFKHDTPAPIAINSKRLDYWK